MKTELLFGLQILALILWIQVPLWMWGLLPVVLGAPASVALVWWIARTSKRIWPDVPPGTGSSKNQPR